MFGDEGVYSQLVKFQLNAVKLPFENGKDFETDYDFISFFRNVGSPLEEKPTHITFTAPKKYEDWPTFAKETVWYGRRKGATLYPLN